MNRFKRGGILSLSWFLIILFHLVLLAGGEGGQDNDGGNIVGKPSVTQILSDTISILKKSHKSSWEKIKTVIHDVQYRFFPPNLDFRSTRTGEANAKGGNDGYGAGGKMTEAVKKSIGSSKSTVEESAKTAAEVAGGALHKTMGKVKESISDKEESHDEL